ncbi:MAG: L-seryl-tRNA(Sec) selenium transferase, partial [Anaerolineales bacterium]|nr:L-seryl-tRNA(Sec) selenium transferase [Anaerolineales bacterium]
MSQQALLRQLPGVDYLLGTPAGHHLQRLYGRDLALMACRAALADRRQAILGGTPLPNGASLEELVTQAAAEWLEEWLAPTLRPVINATGVIIHTNLGRAPLSRDSIAAIRVIAGGYSNLEFDLESGKRGSRTVHAAEILTRLTGAEAALVVNNAASAVMLMLSALCLGKEVIISRGQLVEIGGGFRIPDVMAQSGAKLVEVGTTNRTHLRDYAAAINENTGAILVAHHSNYRIIGFTAEPSLAELAELAHAHNLPLLYDQGSGALLETATYGLTGEPTVPAGLAAGGDLLAFSGDKLLGGPQAGILLGRADLVEAARRHPLARAVRADKLCLAGLTATLRHYLLGEAPATVPIWQMLSRSDADIAAEAASWQGALATRGIQVSLQPGQSTVGGGSLPGETLPTTLVVADTPSVEVSAARLRQLSWPIIGRIQADQLL